MEEIFAKIYVFLGLTHIELTRIKHSYFPVQKLCLNFPALLRFSRHMTFVLGGESADLSKTINAQEFCYNTELTL